MEEAERAVGAGAARERVEHRGLDVRAEVLAARRRRAGRPRAGRTAGRRPRGRSRPSGTARARRRMLGLELGVDRQPARAVGGDEDRVPGAGPAEGRGRALDLAAALRHPRVVVGGDRALLDRERLGRVAADGVGGLGVGAAGCRQRVGDADACRAEPSATWAIAPAPTLPAAPLPTRYVASNAVPASGPAAVDAESPKRSVAAPSCSTSTTKLAASPSLAEQVGLGPPGLGRAEQRPLELDRRPGGARVARRSSRSPSAARAYTESVVPSSRRSATVTPSLTENAPSPPRTTAGPARNAKPRSSSQSPSSGPSVDAASSAISAGLSGALGDELRRRRAARGSAARSRASAGSAPGPAPSSAGSHGSQPAGTA